MKEVQKQSNHTIAVYETHDAAEAAVKLLIEKDYNIKSLSIIGQDYESEERPIGFVNAGDRMLSWGKLGAFWGSIWGLLFGSAMLFVPGMGYLLFAGYIVAAIEGAAIGGGIAALGGALVSIGIPNNSILLYVSELKAGSFMLMVAGSPEEIEKAKILLQRSSPIRLDTFMAEEALPIR